ncbi:MAG: ABC transporter permease subunit [Thermodesulfobacteriota bacterium]
MKGWYAVFHKEVANFFVSPIAYVVAVMFLVISGFFFWSNISLMSFYSMKAAQNPMLAERITMTNFVTRPLIQNMAIVLLFVIPLLTMRLFAEERRSGCIELLLTYPISDTGILVGKFLATLLLFLAMMAGTCTYPLIMASLGSPDWGPLVSGVLGLFLMAAGFVALGMFISSLTENQIVAGAITFGTALMFWVMSWIATFTGETTAEVIRQFSLLEHLDTFTKGVISLSDVTYFVWFTAFFLFLTLRSLEANRWRG